MAYKLLLPTREEFPSQPNQPTNIVFPKRMFSQKLRSFQASWFNTWCWLHYDSSKDAAFCHTCITGLLQHKMKATNVDPAFVGCRMNSSCLSRFVFVNFTSPARRARECQISNILIISVKLLISDGSYMNTLPT